jgi:hypothetical protein
MERKIVRVGRKGMRKGRDERYKEWGGNEKQGG